MAKLYKGFNQKMRCRGFQFEEGKTYEEKEAKLCRSGFHACEMPLDVFKYYDPAHSEYHEVELEELSDEKTEEDTKRCGKRIKIGAKLSIRNLVEAQIEYINERTHIEEGGHATGYQGAASATGYQGAASATGCQGIAVASGYEGRAMGTKGNAICVCERGDWNGKCYPLLAVKAAIVDGKKIKENTWYMLKDGKFVEVDD